MRSHPIRLLAKPLLPFVSIALRRMPVACWPFLPFPANPNRGHQHLGPPIRPCRSRHFTSTLDLAPAILPLRAVPIRCHRLLNPPLLPLRAPPMRDDPLTAPPLIAFPAFPVLGSPVAALPLAYAASHACRYTPRLPIQPGLTAAFQGQPVRSHAFLPLRALQFLDHQRHIPSCPAHPSACAPNLCEPFASHPADPFRAVPNPCHPYAPVGS